MAELLRVNGIPVPVLVEGGARHKPIFLGETERAEDGSKLVSRRRIIETFTIKVAHQSPTDGIAWKKLFTGEGHVWSFDASVYSSKGLGPVVATDAAINGDEVKFGDNSLKLDAGSGTVTFAALPAGNPKWTVSVWRLVDGGAWEHYFVTDLLKGDGHAYVDGAHDGANTTDWLTVDTGSGQVTIDADASDDTWIDDLVILPFTAPESWASSIYDYDTAFSPLAKLDVDGDLVNANAGTMRVCGEVGGVEVMPGYLDGVYHQSIRTLEVTLEEG